MLNVASNRLINCCRIGLSFMFFIMSFRSYVLFLYSLLRKRPVKVAQKMVRKFQSNHSIIHCHPKSWLKYSRTYLTSITAFFGDFRDASR